MGAQMIRDYGEQEYEKGRRAGMIEVCFALEMPFDCVWSGMPTDPEFIRALAEKYVAEEPDLHGYDVEAAIWAILVEQGGVEMPEDGSLPVAYRG